MRLFRWILTAGLVVCGASVFAQGVSGSGGTGIIRPIMADEDCAPGTWHFEDGRWRPCKVAESSSNLWTYVSLPVQKPGPMCTPGLRKYFYLDEPHSGHTYYVPFICRDGQWEEDQRFP